MFCEIAARICVWYGQQQRDLPWRTDPAGHRDAYAVWVCEVMAQQTRIAVVVEYYRRWMARFPTVQSLAAADLQEALKLWEGLGYYSRCRNLHRAARIIVDEFGGEVPRTREELLRLPGIGDYTASAVLSLAFGQAAGILDGNVKRVFSRLWDISTPIDEPSMNEQLWAYARGIVESGSPPGAVNEGLMELGALLCTPRNPRCLLCPLQSLCLSAQRGTQNQRPQRTPRPSIPQFDSSAAVIWEGEPLSTRLLLVQRPSQGLLGGLWTFPGSLCRQRQPPSAEWPAYLYQVVYESLGIAIAVGEKIATISHVFTHFRLQEHVFHAQIRQGTPRPIQVAACRWVAWDALENFPCPVLTRKTLARLRKS